MRLADFYLLLRRPDEAKRTLTEITEKAPDFPPAWRRRAEIAFAERKWDEAVKALDVVLKKSPSDLDGHLLRGRVHLAKRQTTEAIQAFQEDPQVSDTLGWIFYRRGVHQRTPARTAAA